MYFFTASPFLKALGWALVDSIWQFAICWLLYYILTTVIHKLVAAARHTMALFFLTLGTVSFIVEVSWKYYTSSAGLALPGTSRLADDVYLNHNLQTTESWLDSMMPYWSLLYLACILLLFIKLCFFMRRAGSLQHHGITKINAAWKCYIKKVSAQLGIQKEVNAFLSVHIDTPQVIGFLKPVILIPAACLANLSMEQVEAVLLH
ncbi:MAG: M56 family metallopeptidase, partial [Bacteroidota bacterium]